MADYKVQMKQYNGTGFDNILPYASQAETLRGGGTASELITQARAGLCQIATGSYVGTGTYGQSNPTVINCGFKPKMVLFTSGSSPFIDTSLSSTDVIGRVVIGWQEGVTEIRGGSNYPPSVYAYFTQTDTGLSFYCAFAAKYSNNNSGETYHYLAIG